MIKRISKKKLREAILKFSSNFRYRPYSDGVEIYETAGKVKDYNVSLHYRVGSEKVEVFLRYPEITNELNERVERLGVVNVGDDYISVEVDDVAVTGVTACEDIFSAIQGVLMPWCAEEVFELEF